MSAPRLPRPAAWLLRLSPVPSEQRAEVEADLHELYEGRRATRGAVHAHWRLGRDLASLWIGAGATAFNTSSSSSPRTRVALVRGVRDDVRYALRLFARQPGILVLTVAGLALGLGIATAAFSIMNTALRGEGLVEPGRAPGVLRTTEASMATVWSYDEFVHLRAGATRMQVEGVLTEAAPVQAGAAEGAPLSTGAAFVSGGFFAATGGRMTAGRALEPSDDLHAGPPPVVVSFVFWTSRLHQDPAVIGRPIRVGRTEATIVGVAAQGFTLPNNRLLWLPLTAYGAVFDTSAGRRPPATNIQVFGRLLPGVSLAEAEGQLAGVAATLPAGGAAAVTVRPKLDPSAGLGRVAASESVLITAMVFAVIALVLLLACANVATVLIATAITREREMGVRAALGASRLRIVRQLVTESLVLGVMAAGVGLLLALWSIPAIGTMLEAPAGADLSPDIRVYLFLVLVTVATSVGAGLAPAWHGRGADLVTPLKGAGARQDRVAPRRLRSLLVLTQAAASVLLIVLATLFVRASFRAATIDVGFAAEGLYAVSPGIGDAFDPARGPAIRDFLARARAELQGVPGISAVTLAELTPFGGLSRSAATPGESPRVVHFNRTLPDYFETLGIRLVAGRIYSTADVTSNAPVALISQSLAHAYWPDRSPLGDLLPEEIPVLTAAAFGLRGTRPQIIGVVSDAITTRLHERGAFSVYEPLGPESERFAQLLLRVRPEVAGAAAEAGQRLRAIDPQANIGITSIADLLRAESGRPRMLALLTGIVGGIAIFLCVIGLYGLTASVVGQRTREMGVRVAMGAEPGDLLGLLMWDSLRPVVLGLIIGGGAALLTSRALGAAMFFGVSPQDPLALTGASVILLASATAAVLLPTRRAAAVDAAAVLRQS